MRKLKLKKGPSFSKRLRESFNKQNLTKLSMEQEVKLKHFQLALSMVGISANLMTCELIRAISEKCDEMGEAFNIGEANRLANEIAAKYNQSGPPMMPPGMKAPANLPPELQDMINKGHVMMGAKTPEILPPVANPEPIPPIE
jgi:hypothetical protein